jgi:hypothetical protein
VAKDKSVVKYYLKENSWYTTAPLVVMSVNCTALVSWQAFEIAGKQEIDGYDVCKENPHLSYPMAWMRSAAITFWDPWSCQFSVDKCRPYYVFPAAFVLLHGLR